jgi:hypothetical protein
MFRVSSKRSTAGNMARIFVGRTIGMDLNRSGIKWHAKHPPQFYSLSSIAYASAYHRVCGDSMNQIDDPRENISQLLNVFRPIIDDLSKVVWKPSDGFWSLLCCCVLRRQFDALEAIVNLTHRREGHSSVPLLRPACEEFLWIKYLRALDPAIREAIVLQKSQIEIAETVEAQRLYAGDEVMKQFGFTAKYISGLQESKKRAQTELKLIKIKLKWPIRPEFLPSVSFIARATNERELYDLIYHATSRTVHFNVSELLRRAWGDATEVKITSQKMSEYWSRFSLYWGWRIFFFSFVEVAEDFERAGVSVRNFEDELMFERLMSQFSEPGIMPIVTPEELNLHIPKEHYPFARPT